jgi:8-oxo-dGTP diphosphatase
VVAAVIRRDARYLVCRRPLDKRHGGLWEFPGGKVQDGETRADALRRELTEELDLETTELGAVLYSAADDGSAYVIDFIETVAEGAPVLHEHSEMGWFTAGELVRLALAPADADFAASLVNQEELVRHRRSTGALQVSRPRLGDLADQTLTRDRATADDVTAGAECDRAANLDVGRNRLSPEQ